MFPGSSTLKLPPPPALLSVPALIGLELFLNRTLGAAIGAGELDFLEDRRLRIHISDLRFGFDIGFDGRRLILERATGVEDLSISGGSYEFALLASRREDADTLFFQRRLQTEGDTELGLQVKNFLDGQDLSGQPLQRLVENALDKYTRAIEACRRPRDAGMP